MDSVVEPCQKYASNEIVSYSTCYTLMAFYRYLGEGVRPVLIVWAKKRYLHAGW